MAAYGAAVSLKNTIKLYTQSSRISLVSPYPIVEQFIASYCALFDHSYIKVVMAAYAAAVCLNYTISSIRQSFLISPVSVFHISYFKWLMVAYVAAVYLKYKILPRALSVKFIVPAKAYNAMCRLQKVLLKLEETGFSRIRTKVNALDERIKEAIWEFEDLIESNFTNQILPLLESGTSHLSYSVDLWSLKQSVDCFVERVAVMEAEYDVELANMSEEEGEPISSRIDFGRINSEMVGLSLEFERAVDYLIGNEGNRLLVTGMAGVGKTTIAKKIFEDPSIQRHFELRAWVRVGRKCGANETLRCILAQLDPNMLAQDDGAKLVGLLEEILKDKKCLIVFDDVWKWDTWVMDNLPEENVRILVTSRLAIEECAHHATLRLLNREESKKLLGEKVFGEEGFPSCLEKLGEKIAEKCEGLPLMIVTVARLLSKDDKDPECWTEVAEKQHNSIFVDAYDQISEVLFPSYDYLPQYLKMIFLYLGAFPPYSNIDIDSINPRLIAEGFLEPTENETTSDFMAQCLAKLFNWYHLLLLDTNLESWFSKQEFRVHSCWQYLCKREASKIKFLHVLQSCTDVMKDQRRLCAHRNTLFSFKEVYDSIKSDCASTVRSLLCFGPYHKYPVPIHDMDFKLLRVLDAVKVRFYHIPLGILKLVCLKYLALTCNTEIPISISNLLHLQSLIIKPHMNIRKRGVVSYMPTEIWDMLELQYIAVMGRDLPTPNSDATLEKFSCIFGVSAKSCTREILKKVPNLIELGIITELKPYDDDDDCNPLNALGYISEELRYLHILTYNVMNPEMKYKHIVPLSMFPPTLIRLHLSGLGCPWEHMNEIGLLLPNLMDLELKHYAFQGPEWYINPRCFMKLETLVIEDTNLVRWKSQNGSLSRLELLSIRHCYKLQQLFWKRHPTAVPTTVELVECNPLAVISAHHLRSRSAFRVRCHSSF
ncbi:putative late blight resistance protein homolog R1B-17 [Salvia hispanica]|uniref:putative late blight resistance protein homolog R1B-17 n=1 Tax=Salvia hispanica TaxID=49212 RepID=UPI002009BFCD|nr:putative late blight resistance protein homolog R1B-17 [Salvia hispanica]